MVKLQAQNDELEKIKSSYGQDVTEDKLRDLYSKLTGTRKWLPGDGTEQSSYKIYTIEDLVEFSNRSNRAENPDNFNGKYVELMNDVDFKDVRSYENADRTDFGDVNGNGTVEGLRTELTTGTGWQPIAQAEANAFSGTFNGNEIKNLYISNSTSGKALGVFSFVGNSNITDLGITGNLNNNDGFGIIYTATSSVHSISNAYYLNNVSKGVEGITPDPATQMTEAQMKAASFITTLNNKKKQHKPSRLWSNRPHTFIMESRARWLPSI